MPLFIVSFIIIYKTVAGVPDFGGCSVVWWVFVGGERSKRSNLNKPIYCIVDNAVTWKNFKK